MRRATALAFLVRPLFWFILSHFVVDMMWLQSQVIEFSWDDVLQYQSDGDQMTFNFEYRRDGRKPRLVHIFTPYVRRA